MGVVAGLGTFLFTSASAATAVAVGYAVSAGIDLLEDALIPDIPQASSDTMSGRNVTTKNSTATRDVVYGEVRKGGVIVYQEAVGASNEILHEVICFAHGVSDHIEKVWFNDKLAWFYDSDFVPQYMQNGLTVQTRLGDNTYYTPLAGSTDWTTSHLLNGITYLTLSYGLSESVHYYPEGVPKVTVTMRGRKVYDPRESSHSPTSPSTWEYSSNPVLCLYDYLTDTEYGAGLDRTLFDESEIETDADYCDGIYNGNTASSPYYECHGVVKTDVAIRENIKNLLSCMHGKLLFVNGKFKIVPLKPISTHPTTLTEDMIVGDFTMSHTIPRQNQYNIVKGEFINKESRYTKTEYPQQTVSEYVTADKQELIKQFNLPFTTDWVRAQQLANAELRKSRRQKHLKVKVNALGFDYAVNDVIEISNDSLGITSALFQITSIRINAELSGITFDIEAHEYDSLLYLPYTGTVNFVEKLRSLPDDRAISAVTNLKYSWRHNINQQGEAVVGARVFWTPPVGVNVDYYEVSARDTTDNYYISEKYTTTNDYFEIPYLTEEGSSAYIRVIAVNKYGRKAVKTILTVDVIPVRITKAIGSQYVVGNPNVAPTSQQWKDHFGREPVAGDMLTVASKVNNAITDSKTYVFVEEDEIIISDGASADNRIPSKGDSISATRSILLSIDDATNVTWTHSLLSYESNDSSTSMHTLQVTPYTLYGSARALKIQAALPSTLYNSRTTTESILSNKAVLRVNAAYTSTRTGTSYNVSRDIDVLINVLDMQS